MRFISTGGCQLSLAACPGRQYNPRSFPQSIQRRNRRQAQRLHATAPRALFRQFTNSDFPRRLKYRHSRATATFGRARTRERAIDRIMTDLTAP